jgi:hypothetical protein
MKKETDDIQVEKERATLIAFIKANDPFYYTGTNMKWCTMTELLILKTAIELKMKTNLS